MQDSFGKVSKMHKIVSSEANTIKRESVNIRPNLNKDQKHITISNFLESGLNDHTQDHQINDLEEEPTLNLELGQNTRLENQKLAIINQTPKTERGQPEFFAYRDNSDIGDVYNDNQVTSKNESIKITN